MTSIQPTHNQFLTAVSAHISPTAHTQYPFCLPLIKNLTSITFPTNVTFFVGENGTGKSTILEALAHHAGFGPEGGSKNINFRTSQDNHFMGTQQLSDCMTLTWRKKPKNGYFFRAESFYAVANHLDTIAQEGGSGPDVTFGPYGGKSLHEQSHGESFLSLFNNRFSSGGFFILDEPEAALSPQRQLTLLTVMHDLCQQTESQFIIATHSPILLAYPDATIYSCDGNSLRNIAYTDTNHYQITKDFLNNSQRYLDLLFRNK